MFMGQQDYHCPAVETSSKPIMEKRRRARINASLTELKSLLLDAIKREGTRENKMEKADILEMAVNHLRHIQRQQFTGEPSRDTADMNKYQLGFHACVQEVCKYLDSNSDEDLKLKTKLLNHLANCITNTDHQTTASTSSLSSYQLLSTSSSSQVSSMSSTSSKLLSPTLISTTSDLGLSSSVLASTSVDINELPKTSTIRNILKSKGRATISCPDVGKETEISKTPDGILHAVLTSSSPSVVVKPQMVSWVTPGPVLNSPAVVDVKHTNITSSVERQGSISAVKEINNNSVILPAVVNVAAAPSTLPCLQQSTQLQPSYLYQQHQQINQLQLQQLIAQPQLNQSQLSQPQLNQSQLSQPQLNQPQLTHSHVQQQIQPHLPRALSESSTGFSNINPLQLIPTKTTNGDIAFILSATNVINPSNISSLTIPVLARPTLSHAQIVTSPQQPFQIAVSCTPEEQHQSVAFISPQFLSFINPENQRLANISSFTTSQEATPLNLSLTSNQSNKLTNQKLPFQSNLTPGTSDCSTFLNKGRPSLPTSTVPAESNFCQPLLIGNFYRTTNTGIDNQARLSTRDVQTVKDPMLVSHKTPQQSVLERTGSEGEDPLIPTGSMIGQSRSRQLLEIERQRQGAQKQGEDTERKRSESHRQGEDTERERSESHRQGQHTESRSMERGIQQPEFESQRTKNETVCGIAHIFRPWRE